VESRTLRRRLLTPAACCVLTLRADADLTRPSRSRACRYAFLWPPTTAICTLVRPYRRCVARQPGDGPRSRSPTMTTGLRRASARRTRPLALTAATPTATASPTPDRAQVGVVPPPPQTAATSPRLVTGWPSFASSLAMPVGRPAAHPPGVTFPVGLFSMSRSGWRTPGAGQLPTLPSSPPAGVAAGLSTPISAPRPDDPTPHWYRVRLRRVHHRGDGRHGPRWSPLGRVLSGRRQP